MNGLVKAYYGTSVRDYAISIGSPCSWTCDWYSSCMALCLSCILEKSSPSVQILTERNIRPGNSHRKRM